MDEDSSEKARPDVSDDDVRERLRTVLPDVDLQTTTEKQLRKQLEQHFGCDLKSRKAVFKEEIESFLLKNQELFEDEDDKEEAEEEEERPKKSKKRTGLAQRQSLSEQMQTFLDCDESAEYARTDIVKLIWNYIKEKDLQDPKNRRKILPDEKLKLIFTFPLDMFSMNKQLSKHLKPSGSVVSSSDAPPKKKAKKKETAENGEKKKSGFAAPLQLSEPLAELVGQQAASRGEVMKALWAYIKEHELQNPENKKMILVSKDEKLHGVLGVDKCEGFSMSKYLKEHFLGPAQ